MNEMLCSPTSSRSSPTAPRVPCGRVSCARPAAHRRSRRSCAWVEGAVRVLEHHLHRSPHLAKLLALELGDVNAVEVDLARRGLDKPQQCAAGGRLPDPLSPTRPRVSPGAISKLTSSTAFSRADDAPRDALADRELLAQVLDHEQGAAIVGSRWTGASAHVRSTGVRVSSSERRQRTRVFAPARSPGPSVSEQRGSAYSHGGGTDSRSASGPGAGRCPGSRAGARRPAWPAASRP